VAAALRTCVAGRLLRLSGGGSSVGGGHTGIHPIRRFTLLAHCRFTWRRIFVCKTVATATCEAEHRASTDVHEFN
jgi:hypothetical protein